MAVSWNAEKVCFHYSNIFLFSRFIHSGAVVGGNKMCLVLKALINAGFIRCRVCLVPIAQTQPDNAMTVYQFISKGVSNGWWANE